jgi:site-specific DNA-methyltransferase (adenine-specific)
MDGFQKESIGAIVTDPPYGIGFMNKGWDTFKQGQNYHSGTGLFKESGGRALPVVFKLTSEQLNQYEDWTFNWALSAIRILKPGGFLLSMGATRTYHRMTSGIEKAGFEIRDCLVWGYAGAFPKSMSIDREFEARAIKEWLSSIPHKLTDDEVALVVSVASHHDYLTEEDWLAENVRRKPPAGVTKFSKGVPIFKKLLETFGEPPVGKRFWDTKIPRDVPFCPESPQGQKWEGYGTALKPCWEPIVMARKPLDGITIDNLEKHGVGALNIDAVRRKGPSWVPRIRKTASNVPLGQTPTETPTFPNPKGRWPNNMIWTDRLDDHYDKFFLIPKPKFTERDEYNTHPTLKPLKLFRQLIRMVTPPNEVVLDPFIGSGTAAVAAIKENICWVGIERAEEYVDIAERRIESALHLQQETAAVSIFDI